nr:hypothetical protein [Candidatus Sigynarchaeota archaeon]
LTNGAYNPRKIIFEAILGLEEKLTTQMDPNPWLCSTCQKCVELCPQNVDLTEIFSFVKNKAFEKGHAPEAFIIQGKSVLENGVAIPYTRPILQRRQALGLPEPKTAHVDEIRRLLAGTTLDTVISRREKTS